MLKQLRFTLIFLAITPATLFGQSSTDIWSRMGGPDGGLVSEVISDSAGNLLAGMFFGGVYESTDHGQSWIDRNEGLTSIHVAPKGLAASADNYLYAITDVGGMFWRSRTGTDIWHRVDTSLTLGGLLGLRVTRLNTVLLVTGQYGVLRSTDHGLHWTDGSAGLDLTGQGRTIQDMASLPGYIVILTHGGKLYASTNDAVSWSLIGSVPSQPSSLSVTMDHRLFVGGYSGEIWRSTNSGQSWDQVYQDPEARDIWALAASRSDHALYAFRHSGFLMRSLDGGNNWLQLDSISSGGDFYPMAIDPDGHLYVGSDFDGLYRSSDSGATLDTINSGLSANLCINAVVNPDGDVFAMTERYVFRATQKVDRPAWKQIFMMKECDVPTPNPMLWDSVGNFYIGTDLGVWKSSDNGDIWKHVMSPPATEASVDARSLALSRTGTIYLGSRLGLYQSVNEGQNWRELNGPWNETIDKEVHSVVMGRNGRLYWVDYDGFIYWSDDDAFTWHQQGRQGAGLEAVRSDGVMFTSDNRNALLSLDSGTTWIVITPGEGATVHSVNSIALDHEENAIISTDTGIYRITHDDVNYNWIPVSAGLAPNDQTRLPGISRTVEDVRHNHVFYAASRGTSMYRSRPNLSEVRHSHTYAQSRLSPNFPNPFTASTTVRFLLSAPGSATLEVFDATGKTVATKPLGTLTEGEYQTVFDGEDLPEGSYPYVVRTPREVHSGMMTIIR